LAPQRGKASWPLDNERQLADTLRELKRSLADDVSTLHL
jgi:hypothetical protein